MKKEKEEDIQYRRDFFGWTRREEKMTKEQEQAYRESIRKASAERTQRAKVRASIEKKIGEKAKRAQAKRERQAKKEEHQARLAEARQISRRKSYYKWCPAEPARAYFCSLLNRSSSCSGWDHPDFLHY